MPDPAFNRIRFPSAIRQRFCKKPSEVLQGEHKSGCAERTPSPNRARPTSSEKPFSLKLTACQLCGASQGVTQYWSERLNPLHLTSNSSAYGTCIIADYPQTVGLDIQIDVLGIIIKGNKAAIAFIEAKKCN